VLKAESVRRLVRGLVPVLEGKKQRAVKGRRGRRERLLDEGLFPRLPSLGRLFPRMPSLGCSS
jgi:hypothetical protein